MNFDTRQGGNVRATVLDEDGKPLPGLGLEDCVPLTGDSVSRAVTWKGSAGFEKCQGKPIRLRFEMAKARLWSFGALP